MLHVLYFRVAAVSHEPYAINLTTDTRYLQTETRKPFPETRNLQLATRNSQPGTRDP